MKPGSDGEQVWLKTITFCSTQEANAAYECLESTLRDAIEANRFQSAALAVETVTKDNIPFRDICHLVTHGLGSLMLRSYPDYQAMLLDSDVSACQEGMAHGVAEAFGMSDPTDSQWEQFVSACAATILQGPNEGRGCAHGMGHGLYLSESEPQVSDLLLRCSLFTLKLPDEARQRFGEGCSYGVAMSEWSDATLGADTSDRNSGTLSSEVVTAAATTCLSFPQFRSIRDGCMSGLGFSMGSNLFHSGVKVEPTNPLAVPELLDRYLAGCNSQPGYAYGNGVCSEQLLQHVARQFFLDGPQYARFCSVLSAYSEDDLTPERCLLSARLTLGAEQYQDLLDGDPGLTERARMFNEVGSPR